MASLFTGKARETAVAQSTAGRYVFLYAAGYADGRSTRLDGGSGGESVTTDLGVGVLAGLINVFKAPANPCTDKNVRC